MGTRTLGVPNCPFKFIECSGLKPEKMASQSHLGQSGFLRWQLIGPVFYKTIQGTTLVMDKTIPRNPGWLKMVIYHGRIQQKWWFKMVIYHGTVDGRNPTSHLGCKKPCK